MFLRDVIQIPISYVYIRQRVVEHGSECLVESAGRAYRDGERLLLKVGPGSGDVLPSKRVAVTLGLPYSRGEATVIPIFWVATGAAVLFPSLEGDIEVAPAGDSATQITMQATYEPPLGRIGRGVNRLLLHRVAEATARTFLGHLGSSLRQGAPEPAVGRPSSCQASA